MTPVTNLSIEGRLDTTQVNHSLLTVIFLSSFWTHSPLFLSSAFVDGPTIILGCNRLGMCSLYVNSKNTDYAETVLVAEKPGKMKYICEHSMEENINEFIP